MTALDQQFPKEPDDIASAAPPHDDLLPQLAEMRERWVRAEAEIANVRTRAWREIEEARKFAIQKFAGDMAEAAENLKRGLDSLPAATASEPLSLSGLRSGLVEVERGFMDSLRRNGIERQDPTGTVFSPNLHQSIGQQEVATQPAGTVSHAVSSVWMLNGRLLRPAIVLIASTPADAKAK